MAYCGHCGKYVKDGTEICPECGCSTQAKAGTKHSTSLGAKSELTAEQPDYKTILIGKIIVCALGIILGLIVTATSGNISAPYNTADTNNYNEYYNSADYAEFGTDYYTYVYKALKITTENTKSTAQYAAQTAKQMQDLVKIVPKFKIIGTGFGLFIILISAFAAIKSIGSYKSAVYKSAQMELIIGALNKKENQK